MIKHVQGNIKVTFELIKNIITSSVNHFRSVYTFTKLLKNLVHKE